MDWAAGLVVRHGQLECVVARRKEISRCSLEELHLLEMQNPDLPSTLRTKAQFSLSELTVVSSKECAGVFYDNEVCIPDNHLVFSGKYNETNDFLIPAIVLLKALVAPHWHLLPHLFGPGFLFKLGLPSMLNGKIIWNLSSSRKRSYSDKFLEIFAALSGSIAGNAFLAEIHSEALAGRIGFPKNGLTMSAVLNCHLINNRLYCHRMSVKKIQFSSKFSSNISVFVNSRSSGLTLANELESTFDYSRSLNDAEWKVISRIINIRKSSLQSDVRELINIILYRFHTGRSWRSCATDEIPYFRVTQRLREWRMCGIWADVCTALAELRP